MPPRSATPFTASRLVELPPRRIFSVPPVIVRFPIERVPVWDPLPGVMVPLPSSVRAEEEALPVPPKVPPFTLMAPPPVLVPLSRRVPPLTVVVPK